VPTNEYGIMMLTNATERKGAVHHDIHTTAPVIRARHSPRTQH